MLGEQKLSQKKCSFQRNFCEGTKYSSLLTSAEIQLVSFVSEIIRAQVEAPLSLSSQLTCCLLPRRAVWPLPSGIIIAG